MNNKKFPNAFDNITDIKVSLSPTAELNGARKLQSVPPRRTSLRWLSRILVITLAMLLLGSVSCSASSKGSADGMGGGLGADGGAFSDQDLALEAARFADGNIPLAERGGLFDDVFFDFDSSLVPQRYHEQLRQNAQVLIGDPSLQAQIEGHCDKRGTNDYNLALGEERAKAVVALLVGFGVNPDQLSTISYGEEIPLDPRDTEEAYALNRRAHFALSRQGRQ